MKEREELLNIVSELKQSVDDYIQSSQEVCRVIKELLDKLTE